MKRLSANLIIFCALFISLTCEVNGQEKIKNSGKPLFTATNQIDSKNLKLIKTPLGSSIISPEGPQDKSKPFIRMAITKFALPNDNSALLWRTLETLRDEFGRGNFEAYVYSGQKIDTSNTDLILSSAGTYRRNLEKEAKDLATVISNKHPDPNHAEGSVFVVLKDRTDLNSLSDLKGKKVTITGNTAFAGWLIGLNRIACEGNDPDKFFSHKILLGNNMPRALEVLKNKEADVAILRTCFLEESREKGVDTSIFKALGAIGKTSSGCISSTKLYPNWTLFSTPHATPEVARRATLTVLAMEPDKEGRRWGVASDFSEVDQLYQKLKLGPYGYLREWTWKRIWAERSELIVLLGCLLFGFLIHTFRTSYLLKKRTIELYEQEQARLKEKAQRHEAQKRILLLQKTGAVGQISTIIAHELRQPLGAIVNYSLGLLRIVEKAGNLSQANTLLKGLKKIQEEAYSADRIVSKVREYAKGQKTGRELLDLRSVVDKAVYAIQKATDISNIRIKTNEVNIKIFADPLEIELIVVNLLKNAVEAASSSQNPEVEIVICNRNADPDRSSPENIASSPEDSSFHISPRIIIRDNGPRLTDEQFEALNTPLSSMKPEGLGLGLAIVRGLIENLGAVIEFKRSVPHGIEVSVIFPKTSLANYIKV